MTRSIVQLARWTGDNPELDYHLRDLETDMIDDDVFDGLSSAGSGTVTTSDMSGPPKFIPVEEHPQHFDGNSTECNNLGH